MADEFGDRPVEANGRATLPGQPVSAGEVAEFEAIPGVRAVLDIHVDPTAPATADPSPTGLVACSDLARTPELGRCAPGATVAAMPWTRPDSVVRRVTSPVSSVWPAVPMTAGSVDSLPAVALDVSTDGSPSAIESVRTLMEATFPYTGFPSRFGEISADTARTIDGWKQLAEVSIVASLCIAACSLAVSVASSVVERKRPFSLLRLIGSPLSVLQRVIAFETATPLVLVAVAAGGTGLLSAHLFLRAQLSESLRMPGLDYYIAVATGLGVALVVIAATLPMLRRTTGPETARNE